MAEKNKKQENRKEQSWLATLDDADEREARRTELGCFERGYTARLIRHGAPQNSSVAQLYFVCLDHVFLPSIPFVLSVSPECIDWFTLK